LAYGFHWSIVFLQQTLNNQELSAADVERMKHEKRELQKAIEQLEKGRDYFDQQIWEKEMQYAKKHEEVSLEQLSIVGSVFHSEKNKLFPRY